MTETRDFTPHQPEQPVSTGPIARVFAKSWGAEYLGDGAAVFRLWAPDVERLRLRIDGRSREMLPAGRGWFAFAGEQCWPGTPYEFLMADGRRMPDPASRAQSGGVDGPSLIIDPQAYPWAASEWRGRSWEEAVIYELHVGTFTPEGTFAAAAARLGELAALGFTVVQLMPVNQFPGERNWGYDGVLPYAPHHAYGSPDEMKALVDTAHRHGMAVMLDVVYNHLGPRGSLLADYVPSFFDAGKTTPWGPAIDFGQPAVRSYFIENALYWLQEFDLDGLRLDAVDQINDEGSETHFLSELAQRVRSEIPGRHRHLVMEDQRNITRYLERDGNGRPLLYEATWNHDLHHAAHVLATGETVGHVSVFAADPLREFAKGLATGYIRQGELYADGERRGEPSAHLPPTAFINFLQNHDQIGNRALGERLTQLSSERMVSAMTAILLLSPQVPMLFMGDEDGETQPFLFFSDYDGDIARRTWLNRFDEAAHFGGTPEGIETAQDMPDPNLLEQFLSSKLRASAGHAPHAEQKRQWFQDVIGKRRRHIVPGLRNAPPNSGRILSVGEGSLAIDWQLSDRLLQLRANLGERECSLPGIDGRIIHAEPQDAGQHWPLLPPQSVVVAVVGP